MLYILLCAIIIIEGGERFQYQESKPLYKVMKAMKAIKPTNFLLWLLAFLLISAFIFEWSILFRAAAALASVGLLFSAVNDSLKKLE